MAVSVHPATGDRWEDLVAVFGKRGDDPNWCWCQLFVQPETGNGLAPRDNRSALRGELTRAQTPPGLIAYVDEQPAGWTRVGARGSFPGVNSNKALARVLDGDGTRTWWVACFAIAPPYRKSGVAAALLRTAVDFAREQGAAAVEGHPVDVTRLSAKRVAASALYTGTMTLFVQAGFAEVARTHPTRPVMRRVLS